MIYFTKNIPPFNAANGMRVSPIACELKDNRTGYYLGKDWREEIEAKGATVELIEKKDLKTEEGLI